MTYPWWSLLPFVALLASIAIMPLARPTRHLWERTSFQLGLALALGVWTSSSKAFEVIYVVFWYLGVLNDVSELDYLGLHTSGRWPGYLALSFLLFAAALVGRRRQLHR